ncbi:MAG: arginine--tRNA ligase [Chthoniobacterales bacterium]
MPTFAEILSVRLRPAVADIAPADFAPEIVICDPRFGDYQANAAMVLAKQLKKNPRELAAAILAKLQVEDICEPPKVEGAGFINFKLRPEVLAAHTKEILADDRLGVALVKPKTIVIDFSAPNVAKPMHIGHIRSSFIGDCISRIARFLGHNVITDNHIGDWGTQFGKIIYGWKNLLNKEALEKHPIEELVRLYREINEREKTDPALADACRAELVKLQQGDAENLVIWKQAVAASWREFDRMYALLDITFDEKLGESFYNDRLAPLVEKLQKQGIAEISEGAVCVFFRDVPDMPDEPSIIRKRDGGFLYATTDLATLEYRTEKWNPDSIWYVTGAPQQLHFRQVFEIGRRLGIRADLRHIAFGSILGEDRKMMKTRSGDNVSLADVLAEAQERALAIVSEKNPDLPAAEKESIARTIGIGAVKYADLSQHRMTDYVFSWEKMLSFQGNTAPYLQNAYVRIQSIFRKLETPWSSDQAQKATITLSHDAERKLALHLVRFGEILPQVLDDCRPNLLANYLFELANAFHAFYEHCPVLKSEAEVRQSRLALCDLSARVMKQGLALMGISVPEKM